MAYGEVLNVTSGMTSMEEYENSDKIKISDQWNETTAASTYETIGSTSQQPTTEYASTDVSVCK